MFQLLKVKSDFREGEFLPPVDSVIWTERYTQYGDFKIDTKIDNKLEKAIPFGTLLTHPSTKEVMVVEDLDVNKGRMQFTGRSLESIMNTRPSALNSRSPAYISVTSWEAAANLLQDRIVGAGGLMGNPGGLKYPYLECITQIARTKGDRLGRWPLKIRSVGEEIQDWLSGDDVGIKIERSGGSSQGAFIVIHDGVRRDKTVVFSTENNDLIDPRYFFSNRTKKNAVIAVAATYTYDSRVIPGVPSDWNAWNPRGYDLNILTLDMSDVEQGDTETLAAYKIRVKEEADRELKKYNAVSILSCEISPYSQYVYNRDYFMGDIVGVHGDYKTKEARRVVEHTMTADSVGVTVRPTLGPALDLSEV